MGARTPDLLVTCTGAIVKGLGSLLLPSPIHLWIVLCQLEVSLIVFSTCHNPDMQTDERILVDSEDKGATGTYILRKVLAANLARRATVDAPCLSMCAIV